MYNAHLISNVVVIGHYIHIPPSISSSDKKIARSDGRSTVIIVVLIGRNYMFVNLEFHILLKFAKFPKKIVQDKCRKEILLLSWHLISS